MKKEEPMVPDSPTGLAKSTCLLLQEFQNRAQPPFTVMFNLMLTVFFINGMIWPMTFLDVCVSPNIILEPDLRQWPRYLGHIMFAPSFFSMMKVFTIFGMIGYSMENEMGSAKFAIMVTAIFGACSVFTVLGGFEECLHGVDAPLVALAVVMHYTNPTFHPYGADKGIRVDFAVEPRWHLWILMTFHMLGGMRNLQLAGIGVMVGVMWIIRQADSWQHFAACVTHQRAMFAGHIFLLWFNFLMMPFSLQDLSRVGDTVMQPFDYNAWRMWFDGTIPIAPPVYYLTMVATPGVVHYLAKLMLITGAILTLTPRMWYAKIYTFIIALLLMNCLSTPLWIYPHVGFFVTVYLMIMFWRLDYNEPPVTGILVKPKRN